MDFLIPLASHDTWEKGLNVLHCHLLVVKMEQCSLNRSQRRLSGVQFGVLGNLFVSLPCLKRMIIEYTKYINTPESQLE